MNDKDRWTLWGTYLTELLNAFASSDWPRYNRAADALDAWLDTWRNKEIQQ